MTQERFFQIADDPDLLRRITYEELKTLALAYPYAHNLRTMLALKARQIDHPEAGRNLATAAAYSLDRTRLFLLVAPQAIAPQKVLAPEEVLELKPIETVKRALEALSPIARQNAPAEPPAALAEALAPPAQVVPTSAPAPEVDETESRAEIAKPYQPFAAWYGQFHPPILETRKAQDIVPPPLDPEEEQTETTGPPVEKEVPKNQGIAQQLAERSVTENQDVISETLAKLYAKQGYRDKAAQMYARLALLFPEKSAYFAAEIDKLKK